MAVHGKNQAVKVEDPNNLGNYIDISGYCTDANLAFTKETPDTTTFGNSDRSKIGGLRDGSFSLTAIDDPTFREILDDILLLDGPISIKFGPDGDEDGDVKFTADFELTGYSIGGNVGAVLGTAPAFTRTGATTKGTWSSGA